MKAFRDVSSEVNRTHKWRLSAVVAISLAEQLLILAPSILVGQIVDRISSNSLDGTTYLLLVVLALGITQAVLWPLRQRFVADVIQKMVLSRSQALTLRIFGCGYGLFAPSKVGAVTKIAERAIEGFENLLVMFLTGALPALASIALVLLYFAFRVPLALPLILCGAIAYIALSAIVLRWRRDFLDDVNDAEDDVAEYFALTFLAAQAIKVSGYIASALRPLTQEYRKYAITARELAFASGVLKSTQTFITLLTTILAIGAGLWMLQSDTAELTAGDFVIIFSFVGIFMTNLAAVWQIRETLDEYDADSRALEELYAFEIHRPTLDEQPLATELQIAMQAMTTIEPPQLNVQNSQLFSQGERVAISGQSGAGKSVLLEHLVGIRRSGGLLKFNGHDLDEHSEAQVADLVAYSGQKTHFLSGNQDYSIFFRELNAEERARIEVLSKELRLEKVLSGDPEDFTPDTLSGGERRRLALLRALLERKPVMVLDEPTSELDSDLARKAWSLIKRETAGIIVFVASHDDAIIADCDHKLTVSGFTVVSS